MALQTEGKPQTMAEQVRAANAEARKTAATGEGGNPDGTEIEAKSDDEGVTPEDATQSDETDESTENPTAVDSDDEPETPIRIGDQTFKTEREAIAYAEKMERERLVEQAQAQGMRDAIEAMKPAAVAAAEEPDNFEEEFYSNPKEALKKLEERAVDRAVAKLTASQKEEQLWSRFLEDNPEIDRVDAQRILEANWPVLGKIKDIDEAMKELARKTRAEYQRIADRMKPRTELPANKRQAVSAGSATRARGVTPQAEEKPVDFVTQMRRLKGNG